MSGTRPSSDDGNRAEVLTLLEGSNISLYGFDYEVYQNILIQNNSLSKIDAAMLAKLFGDDQVAKRYLEQFNKRNLDRNSHVCGFSFPDTDNWDIPFYSASGSFQKKSNFFYSNKTN